MVHSYIDVSVGFALCVLKSADKQVVQIKDLRDARLVSCSTPGVIERFEFSTCGSAILRSDGVLAVVIMKRGRLLFVF